MHQDIFLCILLCSYSSNDRIKDLLQSPLWELMCALIYRSYFSVQGAPNKATEVCTLVEHPSAVLTPQPVASRADGSGRWGQEAVPAEGLF